MIKLKKFLVLLFVAIIGVALVGCGGEKEPEKEKLPAPTSFEINFAIYEGDENSPYVLIGGNDMYLTVVVNDGADPGVTWAIDDSGNASLTADTDGSAIITGLKGGNAVVTATSTADATMTDSVTVEVIEDSNFNNVVLNAKAEILAVLPEYATANFTLPQPSNENVKAVYKDSGKNVWADGIFQYSYTEDTIYTFYLRLTFKTITLDSTLTIKLVADTEKNSFEAVDYASDAVTAYIANITNDTDQTYKVSADLDAAYIDSSTNLAAFKLLGDFTADEAGMVVNVKWENNSTSDPIVVCTANDGQYMTYSKPLVDATCTINVYLTCGTKTSIVKLNLTAVGYTPDEVYAYFVESGLCPITDGQTFSKSFFKVNITDTTKKFKKLSIVWTSSDESILTYVESSTIFKKVGTGEVTITAKFYYDYSTETVMVDQYDENGNLLKDEDGNVIQAEEIQEKYDWMKEYTFKLTVQ